MTASFRFAGSEYQYDFAEGVVAIDDYKLLILDHLESIIHCHGSTEHPIRVLEMATGNGIIPVVLAGAFGLALRIVAYDINPAAVSLAKHNAELNGVLELIDFRVGSLFEPLLPSEQFHLVIAVLPAVPITSQQLARFPKQVRGHHWVASTGGATGRALVDALIAQCKPFLLPKGVLLTAHADFLDIERTMRLMRREQLKPMLLGTRRKLLRETVITRLRRHAIEDAGYRFLVDENGNEYFNIAAIAGSLGPEVSSGIDR